jgi:hypothetical protein
LLNMVEVNIKARVRAFMIFSFSKIRVSS